MQDENLLKGRVLLWWNEKGVEHQETLEELITHIPPTPEDVERLRRVRKEFNEIRNVLSYYRASGRTPETPEFRDAREFNVNLGQKEDQFERYVSDTAMKYRALLSDESLTPTRFEVAKQHFEQTRILAIRYDPSRKEELDSLAAEVQAGVEERFLARPPTSRFKVPDAELHTDQRYRTLKKEFQALQLRLNTRAYHPRTRGAKKRLAALIDELDNLAIKAKTYDFLPAVNETLVQAYTLHTKADNGDRSTFWKRVTGLAAGLGVMTAGLVGLYRINSQTEILERMSRLTTSAVVKYENGHVRTLEERVAMLEGRTPSANAAPPARQEQKPMDRAYVTTRRIAERRGADWVLYISVDGKYGRFYDTRGDNPIALHEARCTLAAKQGNKQRAGDHRTQEGAFRVERVAIGRFRPLYGRAFMNLENKPYEGLQVTGTDIPAREQAINAGYDSTNGAATFRNKDAVWFVKEAQELGIDRGIVVIEHSARPLRGER